MPNQFLQQNARLLRWILALTLILLVTQLLGFALALLEHVRTTLLLVVFAVLFAYAVYPPVRLLVRRGVPIAAAGAIVYGGFLLLLVGAFAWLAPTIFSQANELMQNYPHLLQSLQEQIANPRHSRLLGNLPAPVRDSIAQHTSQVGTWIGQAANSVGASAFAALTGATSFVIDVAIVLGLTSLFLVDLPAIRHFGTRIIPRAARAETITFMRDVDAILGGFVRGQITIAGLIAVSASWLLLILGVPYAILLALLAALINIVPIVGAIIALFPIAFVAIFTVGFVKTLIAVIVLFIIFQIQQQVINPLFVSKTIGVTPLVLFLALLLGSEIDGVLGALLAMPVAGIARVAAARIFPPDDEELA